MMATNTIEVESNDHSRIDTSKQHVITDGIARPYDYLLQAWLLVEQTLPEEFARIRDILKMKHPTSKSRQIQILNASYSNHMMRFLHLADTLNEQESLTMDQLSHSISVKPSTATRMVDWMVENEFARRLSDSGDRRIVRVALTDHGRNLSNDVKGHLFDLAEEFVRRLPKA